MHLLLVLAPIFFVIALIRLVTLPFRIARRARYGNRYGYGHGYGYRHRHRFGGIGSILALVALDRIFGGRRF